MHQAINLHNIIKIDAWAEPNVNFIYRETTPINIEIIIIIIMIGCAKELLRAQIYELQLIVAFAFE